MKSRSLKAIRKHRGFRDDSFREKHSNGGGVACAASWTTWWRFSGRSMLRPYGRA